LRNWEPPIDHNQDKQVFMVEDDELGFPEGKKVYRLHRTIERNPKVIELAKQKKWLKNKLLCCEVCGFSFLKTYGDLGKKFIEAHHTMPLSKLDGENETRVEEIALVCSNCHKMLHRRRPWLTIKNLKKLLRQ